MNAATRVAVLSALTLSLSSLMSTAAPAATTTNLNLSSNQKSVLAGSLANFQNANIKVGGKIMPVQSDTFLTPAEAIAVQQVLQTGRQSLQLGGAGTAIGGAFAMTANTEQGSGLVVPKGVSAVDIFSGGGYSVFFGNITNAGSLYAVSTNAGLGSVFLEGNNITNLKGATISDLLPGGLLGLTAAPQRLQLTLQASGSLDNGGSIYSTGRLALNARTFMSNENGAAIVAVNDVNLGAADGLTNAGLIRSLISDVTFTAPAAAKKVAITNSGTIEALTGTIRFAGLGDSQWSFNGGNYMSSAVDFNLGSGSGVATLKSVTGTVNATASDMRIQAKSSSLDIGTWNVQGDPVIVDTNSISLNSIVTDGAPIVVISGGNITSSSHLVLSAVSASGQSGNIILLAGAKFNRDDSGNVSVVGGTASGGSVDFSASPVVVLDTSSGVAQGGNVELGAFTGRTAGSGRVLLPSSSSITTAGGGAAPSGSVYVLAGASGSTDTTTLGDINTAGTGAGGKVLVATQQPNASARNPVAIVLNGNVLFGDTLLGGAMSVAPVSIGSITSGGGKIVLSGTDITVNELAPVAEVSRGAAAGADQELLVDSDADAESI